MWSIPILNSAAKERVGYPTQKPLALLDRIIRASSKEGDAVLDPFAGCATACVAAERLQRQWVGIDLPPLAAKLVNSRLQKDMGLFFDIHHREDIPSRTERVSAKLQDAPAHALWPPRRCLWRLSGHISVPQYDGGSHGGFNRSSQHSGIGGCYDGYADGGRIGLDGASCIRQVDRTRHGVRSLFGSGQRLRRGVRARTRPEMPVYPLR